jgi:hypothetical protein
LFIPIAIGREEKEYLGKKKEESFWIREKEIRVWDFWEVR